MPDTSIRLAEIALRQQVEICGSGSISLDSLWRATGCPSGRDPRAWIKLATPLVSGFAVYQSYFYLGADGPIEDEPLLWEWEAEDSDPWRRGDLMTSSLIARVYATFLDANQRPRRDFR
jgi:hypothetical protein